MVKINRIYTRTGDDGSTGLVGGNRIVKDSLRVEAFGDVDELNSVLGLARSAAAGDLFESLRIQLASVQNQLFDLGCVLATPASADEEKVTVHITEEQIAQLESWIDSITEQVPPLRSFVLPGGTMLNGFLHLARATCRRAERATLALSRRESVPAEAIKYLNRLSDYLFAAARLAAVQVGVEEFLWVPGKS